MALIDLSPYVKESLDIEEEHRIEERFRKLNLWWAFGLGISLTLFFGGILLNVFGG